MAKTKYSYKYNGQIVRNSNRLYKYGLVNHEDIVVACSSTEKGALKDKSWYLNHYERNLEFAVKHNNTEYAANYQAWIDNIKKWHVVELEVVEN